MKFDFIKKKSIIFSIIVILLLVAGGVFYWWENRLTPPEKWEAAKVSREEDYIVKEIFEGKIVENKKIGLSYEIPKDWILENGNPTRFYSSDTKFKGDTNIILEKGCKIYVSASYFKIDLDTLKKFIETKLSQSSLVTKIDESSVIKVSNYSALRHEYHIDKFGMSFVIIDFPSKDKVYRIWFSTPIEEKERCEEEFNKFLETVSIK